ncbi:MAG: GtrA family protein [Christensenellales bacterium]
MFSASAGVIQLASFTLFKEALQWPYFLAYGLALVLSVLWNFTFNRRYTFRSDADVPRAMALVALYYAVFTPLSIWWGEGLAKAGWNEYLVLGGTMLINFLTEFLYQRFVVYTRTLDTNEVARRASARKR